MARIKPGVPTVKEIREGESEYRYIHGVGLVLYTRYNNKLYCTKMHDTVIPPIIDKKLGESINTSIESSITALVSFAIGKHRFSVPFMTFVYTDNGGTRRIPNGEYISSATQTHNVDVSGIWATLATDTWTELDGYLGTGGTIAKYIIPPYACRLEKIIFRGSFDVSGGNDTADTTIAMSFISKNATDTTDENTSQSATIPNHVVTGGNEALWVFPFSTGWTIPVNGYAALNYTVAEPSNALLRMMQGIAVFVPI
jgi:hypothetical protein